MQAMREALVAADFECDSPPSRALLLGLHRELNLLEDALEDNDAESAALLTASLLMHMHNYYDMFDLSAIFVEAKRLSKGEAELRSEAESALELVQEEGSTAILPTIIEELHFDLDKASKLLKPKARKLPDTQFVVALQKDIERTLEAGRVALGRLAGR